MKDMFQARSDCKCPFCGKDMKNASFRNAKSKKEFSISGLCQECQDDVFGRD